MITTMRVVREINFKVNITYGDSSIGDDISEQTNLVLFVLWGIVLCVVVGAGLVGNILTMLVLWRREMKSSTILYLRGLVISDTGILIGSLLTLTPISFANYIHGETLDYFKDNIYPVIFTPGYYIIMTLQQINVWITVSVSMERYIAICHPFRAARLISTRKTIIVIVVIVVVSLLYNLPHIFATSTADCTVTLQPSPPPTSSSTVSSSEVDAVLVIGVSETVLASTSPLVPSTVGTPSPHPPCLEVVTTDFGNTVLYKTYRTYLYAAIIYVIPFLALLILNSFLIKELMSMQRRRTGTNIHDENEANLSLVLVLIVIVFIFCQTPGLISQFDVIHVDFFIYWLAVSNVLFTTNSAVNFLIYTAFGRKFRRVLLRVFRRMSRSTYTASQYSRGLSEATFNDDDDDVSMTTETRRLSIRSSRCNSKVNGKISEHLPLTSPAQEKVITETSNGTTPTGSSV